MRCRPHHKDIAPEVVWPQIARIDARFILVEMANARHANDLPVIARFFKEMPGKVLVPGVATQGVP